MPTTKASRQIPLNACLKALSHQQSNQPSKLVSVNSESTTVLGKLLNGRYQIMRVLGAGGFSQTYLAKDIYRPSNPTCVVKHFKPASSDLSFLQIAQRLFQTEAEILDKLGHYNQIPQLLAYFEEEQNFYLVQEYIEGQPLSAEMPPGYCWSESQVIQLLQEVLELLVFIHSHGVIHRDIKPDNLIRRKQDNKLVLIDFGSIKQIRTQTVTPQGHRSATTPIGTQGYMAPEQGQGNPRPNSDLYALGIIGVQALTGLEPTQFQLDSDTGEICWQQQAKVSSELASFISNLVSYHFKDRYQSATEALEALQPLTKTQSSNPPRYSSSQVEAPSQQLSTPSILLSQVPDSELSQKPVFSINPSEQPIDSKNRSWIWAGIGTGLASAVALSAGISSLPDSSVQNAPDKVVAKPNIPNSPISPKKKEPPQTNPAQPPQVVATPVKPSAQPPQVVATPANPSAQPPKPSLENVSFKESDKSVKEAQGTFESKVNNSQTELDGSLAKLKKAFSRLSEAIAIAEEFKAQGKEANQETEDKQKKAIAQLQQQVETFKSETETGFQEVDNHVSKPLTSPAAAKSEVIAPLPTNHSAAKAEVVTTPANSPSEWESRVMATRTHPYTEEPEIIAPLPAKSAAAKPELSVPPTTNLPTVEPEASTPLLTNLSAEEAEVVTTPTNPSVDWKSRLTATRTDPHTEQSKVMPTPTNPSIDWKSRLTATRTDPHTKQSEVVTTPVNSSPKESDVSAFPPTNSAPVISPDGQHLVGISANNTIKIWNMRTGELLNTLKGHSSNVQSVAISSDGQTLTSVTTDNTIKTWNLHTGELLGTLTGH